VFANSVLRRLFGSKREEVAGGWRGPHNEELHNLYASPDVTSVIKLRRMRWAGHVTHLGDMRNACGILTGKSEGKRPLGIPRHRWEVHFRLDRRETGWAGVDWIHLTKDGGQCWALVSTVMNLQVPQQVGNFLTS